jgi:uncharacterized protein (DUF1330 family)
MPYEKTVGLYVQDNEKYDQYRKFIGPILAKHNGEFVYDCHVSDMLKPHNTRINRLFLLRFPSNTDKEKFFTDPEYQVVRDTYFTAAVAEIHYLSETGL